MTLNNKQNITISGTEWYKIVKKKYCSYKKMIPKIGGNNAKK